MNENKFDMMLKSYCNRDVEQFEFKEKNHKTRYTSVLAATLVLAIIATVIFAPLSSPKNDFTLTVSAAETLMNNDTAVSTSVLEFYSADGYFLDAQEKNQVIIGIDGDDIVDVKMKSQNGFNQFFLIEENVANCYNSDGELDNDDDVNFKDYDNIEPAPDADYDDAIFVDNDGVVTSDYFGEEIEYYVRIDEDITNEDVFASDLCLVCTAIDENGYYLTLDKFSSEYDDIIEITVTFTDNTTLTKYVSITYVDGVLIAEETTI